MIAVFLNNKLIAADTVMPLLLEFHAKWPRRRFQFYCFDTATEQAIRDNTIIAEAMASLGPLRMIGRRKSGPLAFLTHRLRSFLTLAQLSVRALTGGTAFIHFKALNPWPLRLLYLANRRHTFYMQPSTIGASDAEKRVDEINRPRIAAKHGPAAAALVAFDQNWPPLRDPRAAGLSHYHLPPPYQRRHWHDYLDQQATRHIGQTLTRMDCDPNARFITFMLSSMDPTAMLTEATMFPQLFRDSLDALARAVPDVPVLIKPHPATRKHYLAEIEQALAERPAAPLALTNLHPLLLARGAYAFLGNVFSSTFANAATMNLPTIEYTSYSGESLTATGGNSIRPDLVTHFINGDSAALDQVLRHVTNQPSPPPPSLLTGDPQTDAFFAALNNRAANEAPAGTNPRSIEA